MVDWAYVHGGCDDCLFDGDLETTSTPEQRMGNVSSHKRGVSANMKSKMDILDKQHWVYSDYKQRITARAWREILLNNDDKIIFNGRVVTLVAKKLQCGVYEVTKDLPSL